MPRIDGDVIVFLSGGSSEMIDVLTSDYYLSSSSTERLFATYRLHKMKKLPVILTGGRVYDMPSDAEISYNILVKLGVEKDMLFVDNKSRDTYENAYYSKEICEKNGFSKPILVSDCLHIPRAVLSFKKAGFKDVFYYPSSCLCHKTSFMDFLPSDFYFHRKYLYEKLGYFFYKLYY